ncbi:unnamed protein product, partial [Phaeothamnion confervicola]
GIDCSNPGNSLSALALYPGRWRATSASLQIETCLSSRACPGGAASEPDGYCGDGYEGPLCAACRSGYARGFGDACHECGAGTATAFRVVAALAGVLGLVAAFLVGRWLVGPAGGNHAATCSAPYSARSRAPETAFSAIRIALVFAQIVTLFASLTGAELPAAYCTFLGVLSVFNLDLGLLLSMGCLWDADFYDRLLILTLAPLALLLLLGCTFLAATWQN